MAILIENRQRKIKIDLRRLRRSLNRIVNDQECGKKELSLLFVDNNTIREINRTYLARDYVTNVISFSLAEGEYGTINPAVLGDIVISVEKALRDARKARMDFYDELDFLMIHGLLHLLGYDHIEDADYKKMHKKETELLKLIQ